MITIVGNLLAFATNNLSIALTVGCLAFATAIAYGCAAHRWSVVMRVLLSAQFIAVLISMGILGLRFFVTRGHTAMTAWQVLLMSQFIASLIAVLLSVRLPLATR